MAVPQRRKEAERIADEELLRSIEAGTTRRNRYGKVRGFVILFMHCYTG